MTDRPEKNYSRETDEADYKKMFEQYVSFVQDSHERNRRKIKTGLKVNLILPWLFLIISYLTDRSKLFFLILWILSLFGIAFYLVYIEYSDYQMQRMLGEMDKSRRGPRYRSLTGSKAVRLEINVTEQMERIDHKIESIDRRMEALIKASARRLAEKNSRKVPEDPEGEAPEDESEDLDA